jgi:hypothetical protein
LNAVGTSTSPIVFTSWQDNSVGGATGNAAPAAGDWSGIYSSGGTIDLENADVSYSSVVGSGMVSLKAIADSFISNQGNAAIEVQGAAVSIQANVFTSPPSVGGGCQFS